MYVVGDIYATGTITQLSDLQFKSNVTTIESALEKVNALRGVYYTNNISTKREMGLIAQEVLSIIPEVISKSGETLGVGYGKLVGLLIESIKELTNRIEYLENK